MVKNSNNTYKKIFISCFILGGAIIFIAIASMFTSSVPSGNVCAENVAYLQQSVDAYKEALGEFPTELTQLLETEQGKGPFVEKIDFKCPSSGKPYLVSDGQVISGS